MTDEIAIVAAPATPSVQRNTRVRYEIHASEAWMDRAIAERCEIRWFVKYQHDGVGYLSSDLPPVDLGPSGLGEIAWEFEWAHPGRHTVVCRVQPRSSPQDSPFLAESDRKPLDLTYEQQVSREAAATERTRTAVELPRHSADASEFLDRLTRESRARGVRRRFTGQCSGTRSRWRFPTFPIRMSP